MEGVLEQVALRTGLHGAQNVHIAFVGRHHDHFCIREFRSNGDERSSARTLRIREQTPSTSDVRVENRTTYPAIS